MPLALPRITFAAALAAAAPAFAQDPPVAGLEPDVIVTGNPELDRQIRGFVGALTPSSMTGQLARFEEPICPAAFGLADAARDTVVARMRAVAAAVGLRTGEDRCTPNVLLMVTRDKRTLIQALARRNPAWFGDEVHNDAYGAATQPGPVSVWHAEQVVNADGRALRMQGGFAVNRTTRPAGRVNEAARPAFVAAAVIVEAGALVGLSTTQLADYAMMRALARTDPTRLPASAPDSILRVIDAPMGGEVPITMTRWDVGFLRGLYAGQPNLRAPAHRGAIGRRLAEELRQAEAAGN